MLQRSVHRSTIHVLAVVALGLLSAGSAKASTTPAVDTLEDGRTVYQTEYFGRYAPVTARDMVQQIPGFTLVGNANGNGNQARGLGQGDGNLLINGRRPTSKDDTAFAMLGRIPADAVARVEVLKEGSTELAGQSGQIVNVVTNDANRVTGSVTARVHTVNDGGTDPMLEASLKGSRNAIDYSVGINWYGNSFPQWGPEHVYAADGRLREVRDEYSNFYNRGTTLNVGFNWQGLDGRSAALNGSSTVEDGTFVETSDRFAVTADEDALVHDSLVDFINDERRHSYEIGGEYAQAIAAGQLKLIGLRRNNSRRIRDRFANIPVEDLAYYFSGRTRPEETESILRGLYTITPRDEQVLEFALEGVSNTLDTTAEFEEDSGGGPQTLILPGSDVKVTEKRAEISVQYSRPLGSNANLQARFATEYSDIAANDGINVRQDQFVRPKGFVSTSLAVGEFTRWRARLERSVGQLDFFDFASSTNANEGTVNGGNTALVPDQTWRGELGWERRFGNDSVVNAVVFAERTDDFVTFIPFGDGSEGRGNIDSLRQWGLDLNATLSLDTIGLTGAKLDLQGQFHRAEYTDPVTGMKVEHRWNGNTPVHYVVGLRHDVPGTGVAWGVVVEELSSGVNRRLDRVIRQGHAWPMAHRFYIQHKRFFGMTARFEIEDSLGYTYHNSRTYYEGDRNGPVRLREVNERKSPWLARFSISRNF